MVVNAYNPNVDLDPQAWLASDEESRINVVVRYHQTARLDDLGSGLCSLRFLCGETRAPVCP